jgi:hypothetical protein
MIIEAGYDIVELLLNGVAKRHSDDTRLHDDGEHPLWVLTMDAQLRYWSTTRVVDRMGASTGDHVEDIARTLNDEPQHSVYYVLAHTTNVRRDDDDDWLYEADQIIKDHPSLAGHELLGHVVFDATGFFSTVPRYSFRDYIGLEHLPRAASCAGPHEWLDCPCAACVQFDELLQANRQRSTNRSARLGSKDSEGYAPEPQGSSQSDSGLSVDLP